MIEYAHNRAIGGFVLAACEGETPVVEFRIGDRRVGRAAADAPRPEGGFRFKTLLDMDGEATVSAARLADGAPLANSPCLMTAPAPGPSLPPPAWAARVETVKRFAMRPGEEVALFCTASPGGALRPHVSAYLRALRDEGIAVLLVAGTDGPLDVPSAVREAVAGAIVRTHAGPDFAAWAHALCLHPELYGSGLLYLLNDRVSAPAAGGAFPRLLERVRASSADLIGLTESQDHRWHLQSYFLALRPALLSSQALQAFMRDVPLNDPPDAPPAASERRFAAAMEEAGYRVETLYPGHAARDPVVADWRALIADGLPFMALAPLQGAHPEVDLAGWRETLTAAGFDTGLIDATVRGAARPAPLDPDDRLVARPIPRADVAAVPKVAFFGPWNYDDVLGAAARRLVAAIRRTRVPLNLHPVGRPFDLRRPLAPPVDVIDFTGAADIAVINLDPDHWHLLTDAQHAAIDGADRRIGAFTCATAPAPSGWPPGFGRLARIWAPSRRSADLLATLDEAPVDMIPFPVPLPPAAAADSAPRLAAFGLPADRRLVLCVFGGADDHAGDDPTALVRAFTAAGLARAGWVLVLARRHPPDWPDRDAALHALVAATPEVMLVERTLSAAALADLVALADIYAAPGGPNGFGTIAAAMAAGKPVVAAGVDGSADILDAATGYVVPTYPGGLHAPARIEEAALAAALARAAAAHAGGDFRLGDAAHARIAERLSYAAVGRLIARSFSATMTDPDRPPPFRRISPTLAAGVAVEHADLGHRMHAVALAPDGSATEASIGLPAGVPGDRDHWLVFAPAGSRLHPLFSRITHEHALERPDVDIFYTDDLAVGAAKAIDQLRLKPAFDITLLAAQDYVGAPLIVRAAALAALGGMRREAGTAAVDDLLLRGHGAGLSIARIDWVLLAHPGERPRAALADRQAVLAAAPAFASHDLATGGAPGTLALRRRFTAADTPPVTIVIPTRQTMMAVGAVSHVERLLAGIARADWPMDRLTVIVGDDVVSEPGWAAPEAVRWPFALRRVETTRAPGERFNYAVKMNRLWRLADTEHIVFMNDDVRPVEPGWLKALMTFATDRGVGGVGARLLYEDGRLQHAGIAPHGMSAAHAWVRRERIEGTYQDWALVQREWSMVTGAVFATRRGALEEVDGFDEIFSVEFNDVDLCLRLRMLGYRIVYNPDAELVHIEKASRGEAPPPGDELARFLTRWRDWLDHDPSWHRHLRRDRVDVTPQLEEGAWYF